MKKFFAFFEVKVETRRSRWELWEQKMAVVTASDEFDAQRKIIEYFPNEVIKVPLEKIYSLNCKMVIKIK